MSDLQELFLDGDGFGAALCAKLAADGIDMLIHGVCGDVELRGVNPPSGRGARKERLEIAL